MFPARATGLATKAKRMFRVKLGMASRMIPQVTGTSSFGLWVKHVSHSPWMLVPNLPFFLPPFLPMPRSVLPYKTAGRLSVSGIEDKAHIKG